jgi:hypothetical protein
MIEAVITAAVLRRGIHVYAGISPEEIRNVRISDYSSRCARTNRPAKKTRALSARTAHRGAL